MQVGGVLVRHGEVIYLRLVQLNVDAADGVDDLREAFKPDVDIACEVDVEAFLYRLHHERPCAVLVGVCKQLVLIAGDGYTYRTFKADELHLTGSLVE